ncbi:MAG: hypothetical protein ACYDHW_02290 [Syntrophorhabdaceae bacterium]
MPDDYPDIADNPKPQKNDLIFRIALYSGLAIVIALSVGGYYLIKSHQVSFIKLSARNERSGPINPVNLNAGDDPFIGTIQPGEQKKDSDEASVYAQPSTGPVNGAASSENPGPKAARPQDNPNISQSKPPIKPVNAQAGSPSASPVSISDKTNLRTGDSAGAQMPAKGNSAIMSTDNAARKIPESSSQGRPEILDQLVLKDDNPFREKFVKKFQDTQAMKLEKAPRPAGKASKTIRFSKVGGAGNKPGVNLGTNELAILPGIAGSKDPGSDFRVLGVIQANNTALVLTNRGEMKIGSMVGGDIIASVTMNEVRLKSGRIVKVSGQ